MTRSIHLETPATRNVLGGRGAGEDGAIGAPAAIATAVTDALAPTGFKVNALPIRFPTSSGRAPHGALPAPRGTASAPPVTGLASQEMPGETVATGLHPTRGPSPT